MLIDIDKVKVSDRIRKDLGDIGELANDIKENGLINPPVVTPEYELIAGERRLRACKQLGFQQIEVRVMSVRDQLHFKRTEVNENTLRKDFTFSEMMDAGRELERLEKLYAKERQGIRTDIKENFPISSNGQVRDIVAEQIGIGSGRQYEKAKYISDNADEETIQKLDNGEISIHKAYTELKNKLNQVEKELEEERNKPSKEVVVEKERVVDNTDYNRINQLENELNKYKNKITNIENQKQLLQERLQQEEKDANEYKKLKRELEDLHSKKDDLHRQIESVTSISGLVVEIEHMLQNKLAPVKYSRAISEKSNDQIVIDNLNDIVNRVYSWCDEMKSLIPKTDKNIIDAEVIEYE